MQFIYVRIKMLLKHKLLVRIHTKYLCKSLFRKFFNKCSKHLCLLLLALHLTKHHLLLLLVRSLMFDLNASWCNLASFSAITFKKAMVSVPLALIFLAGGLSECNFQDVASSYLPLFLSASAFDLSLPFTNFTSFDFSTISCIAISTFVKSGMKCHWPFFLRLSFFECLFKRCETVTGTFDSLGTVDHQ